MISSSEGGPKGLAGTETAAGAGIETAGAGTEIAGAGTEIAGAGTETAGAGTDTDAEPVWDWLLAEVEGWEMAVSDFAAFVVEATDGDEVSAIGVEAMLSGCDELLQAEAMTATKRNADMHSMKRLTRPRGMKILRANVSYPIVQSF